MAMYTSLALCPINFKEFDRIRGFTENIEAALLLSKINFHLKNTKITRNGNACIARSREQMSSWFGFGKKKVDRLLNLLQEKGLIEKKTSTWYGTKRLFLSSTKEYNIPVNMSLLKNLTKETGSIKEALVFSKIAFKFANTKIIHENKKWCTITIEDLSQWSGLSERSISSIINNLSRKGLILKKNYSHQGRSKSHFHIPEFVIGLLKSGAQDVDKFDEKKVIHSQNCKLRPAKKGLSIRVRTNTKKTNNNTAPAPRDINFKNKQFPQKQKHAYTKAALENTIKNFKLRISNQKDLLNEILFSINSSKQGRGVSSFKHAVNRIMAIIRDGNWRTPIGFHNHSEAGKNKKEAVVRREEQWVAQKNKDCVAGSSAFLPDFKKSIRNPHDEDLKKICEQYIKISKHSGQTLSTARYQEGLVHKIKVLLSQGASSQILNNMDT